MTPEPGDTRELAELDRLLELPEDARRAELATLEQNDAALAQRVRTLLAIDAGIEEQSHAPAAMLEGTRGIYRPVELIGRGATARVWLAVSSVATGDEAVAVKIIDQHGSAPESLPAIPAIHAELTAAHPARRGSALPIIDTGRDQAGRPFFVMPLVRGEPLLAHADARALPLHDRLSLLLGLCEAARQLHDREHAHGDIKPGNTLVDQQGHVHLLDCDGVVSLRDLPTAPKPSRTQLTRLYAAPELLEGGAPTPAADIYAIGVVLGELVWARRPAPAAMEGERPALRFATDEPTREVLLTDQTGLTIRRPLADVAAERALLPTDLAALARGGLAAIAARATAPEHTRYQSIQELETDLRAWIDSRPARRYARPPTARLARRRLPWLAAVILLVLIAAGALSALHGESIAREATAHNLALSDELTRALTRTGVPAEMNTERDTEFTDPESQLHAYLAALADDEDAAPIDRALAACTAVSLDHGTPAVYAAEVLPLLGIAEREGQSHALTEFAVVGLRAGLTDEPRLLARAVLESIAQTPADEVYAAVPALITLSSAGAPEEALSLLQEQWGPERFEPESLHALLRIEVLASAGDPAEADRLATEWIDAHTPHTDPSTEEALARIEQMQTWIGTDHLAHDWAVFLGRVRD